MALTSQLKFKKGLSLLFIFSLFHLVSNGQGLIPVVDADSGFQLNGSHIGYVEIDSEQVLLDSFGMLQWKPIGNTNTLSFSDVSKVHVLKVTIENKTDREDWKLTIPVPNLDYVNLYSGLHEGQMAAVRSGDRLSSAVRLVDDADHTFDINLPKGETRTFYITVKSSGGLVFPINLETTEGFHRKVAGRNIFFGIFTGIMLIMFLYNLVVFFYTQDRTYLFYLLYVFFVFLAQASFLGVSYYFAGSRPYINNMLIFIGSGVSGVFGCLFIRYFLKTFDKVPKLNLGLSVTIAAYLLLIVMSLLGFYEIAFALIQIAGLMVVVVFLSISITLSLRGERFAKVYLIAWTPIFIGLVLVIMRDVGLLPFTTMTSYMFPFGVILETVMLSLALADQINILKMDNERTHKRVIEEIHKNQELVKNQNIMLEEKVRLRTQELEDALDNLKSTQSQLVQSEKMASLGVLTAGIAHEINNPINFVTANVVPLRENIEDVKRLLDAYKNINWQDAEKELEKITKLEEEMELKYMLEETTSLIDGIEEGARRTHNIVDGLKSFSRGDGGENNKASINQGISSTLSVLKSRLKGVNVQKELDESIPLINCQIGKLNQVFLNLLNNAIDAVDLKHGPNASTSEITIRTYTVNENIIIEVEDNGGGIAEENQKKIFEPFFTTKPIGKGTGLGLSISYGIVEEHNGEMKLESTGGKGSKFTIAIPIDQEQEETTA